MVVIQKKVKVKLNYNFVREYPNIKKRHQRKTNKVGLNEKQSSLNRLAAERREMLTLQRFGKH